MRDGSGIIVVVCCLGLAWCLVKCVKIEFEHRDRVARWWERHEPKEDQ